jgi:hypothetical protein
MFGSEFPRKTAVVRAVGIRPDPQAPSLVGPLHQAPEVLVELGFDGRDLTIENVPGRPVEREEFPPTEGLSTQLHGAGGVVEHDVTATGDTALAHAPGHHRRVRGHAPALGEDTDGCLHARDVLRAGFPPHEHGPTPLGGRGDRFRRIEHDLPAHRPGTGRQAPPEHGEISLRIKHRMQELIQLVRGHALDRLTRLDQLLLDHFHGDPYRGRPRPLAAPHLKHPELVVLDGEFEIEHVAVVLLETPHDLDELGVALGHLLLERLAVRGACALADGVRGPHPGHHILALRVHEVLAVEEVLAGRRVARERDPGCAVLPHVAEDHGLDVHGRSPVVGVTVHVPVMGRAVVIPAAEHGEDRIPQLHPGILGKITTGVFPYDRLVALDQLLEIFRLELGVLRHTARFLERVECILEVLAVDPEHDVAEHLNEATVGVVGKARVRGLAGQTLDRLVVEPEVQNGVHHSGHADPGPGPD